MSEDDAGDAEQPAVATPTATLEWANGRTLSVEPQPDEPVLDAAERADAGLPYGCRHGACGTCAARLLDGDPGSLDHRRPPRALKPRHLDAGYVLLCVAEARSDCRLRVGSDVLAETRPAPWRDAGDG
ncbi:MAG: ferredoxin [uncultured archaeon A07HB70]|nr:MAG: ferredoxin [uncultured archaeon A07HB70]